MCKLLKYFQILTFSFLLVFFLPKNIFAQSEFSTSYDITYNVDLTGLTTTKQVVNLSNNLDHIFATEYTIIIGSTKITDIKASDNFGELTPEITQAGNSTNIKFNFNERVIGKNKSRNIVVNYKTKDFAVVKGHVLEVGFPLLANSQELQDYKVVLNIPNKFGKPTQIIPENYQEELNTGYNSYIFSKATLVNQKGINATFGTEQIYNFTLKYSLQNDHTEKGKTDISLPSDTNHQQIIYTNIFPKPVNVKTDADGNWLAEYIVEPKTSMTINAEGSVMLNYFPRKDFEDKITPQEIESYTKSDLYWQTSDPKVKTLAEELKTPEGVYKYLVSNFIYDYGRLNNNTDRLGAVKALENPDNAICMEFTDAFVALVRALKIPARELNGYAHTENDKLRPLSLQQDVLHAWPEYYDSDKKQWIQVDPTWGNTTGGLDFFHKFDLDHIVFVTHGIESTYPVTVGSYKTKDSQGKDVEMTFGTEFNPKLDFDMNLSMQPSGLTGLPMNGNLTITNTGNAAIYETPIDLVLYKDGIEIWKDTQVLDTLPPFAFKEYPVKYQTNWQQSGGKFKLIVSSDNKKKEVDFKMKTILSPWVLIITGGGSVGAIIWIAGYKIGWMIIRKRKKIVVAEVLDETDQLINDVPSAHH